MRITLSGTEVAESTSAVNQILVRLAKSGRVDAAGQLLEANELLIAKLITEYTGLDKRHPWWDDLKQEADRGIMEAIDLYQEDRGRFMSYAKWRVKKRVCRLLSSMGSVYVPDAMYWRARKEHNPRHGTTIAKAKSAMSPNGKFNKYDDLAEEMDPTIVVENRDGAAVALAIVSQHKDPRVCYIVRQFYGLDGQPARTLKNIGEELDLCKERVRQLREEGLDMVREQM